MSRLSLYFHTLRHLKPVQFYGRLWLRLYRPRPDLRAAPPLRPADGGWRGCARAASMVGPERFRFLNVTCTLASASDWNRPDWPKLWLYNAHYFDDLLASDAAQRSDWHRALIARWIAENPPGQGNGWEPYPTSLRIVNWIKWALSGNPSGDFQQSISLLEPLSPGGRGAGERGKARQLLPTYQLLAGLNHPHPGPPPSRGREYCYREIALNTVALHSLAVQTRWLCKRLEHHLLGNHLWANAKALVFAGCFFDGPEAARWRERGLALLRRELTEQILPDGGHFERSPMYHAIVLEDLLDLINLATLYPERIATEQSGQWHETAGRMRHWLRAMCHPDGEIALFNDAAFGIAPTPEALFGYAERLGISPLPPPDLPLVHLPETGYLRYASGPLVALLDLAPIGPDYLPGHAHADTLSFELSLHGQRVIVNGGTGCYGTGAERLRQRGTAAHSTVTVDGQDSSEVWGGFRVARRARPFDLVIEEPGPTATVACSHDGYQRLPGKVTHRRHWRFEPGRMTVTDTLTGSHAKAVARYHFHPDIEVHREPDTSHGTLRLPDGQRIPWQVTDGRVHLVESRYHPEFGIDQPTTCLTVTIANNNASFHLKLNHLKLKT